MVHACDNVKDGISKDEESERLNLRVRKECEL